MLNKRFWTTVSCFTLANIGAWIGFNHTYQLKTSNLLRVERFTPGDQMLVGNRPTLTWEFNLDIAETYRTGEKAISSPVLIQTPTQTPFLIPGRWEWTSSRKLTFTPETDLPKATPFTLTLPAHTLESKEGFRLNNSYSATIKTSPLEVLSIRQAAFDERDQFMLEIEFNDKVLPLEVMKYLEVESLNQQKIPFRLYGESSGNIIRIITDPTPLLQQNSETYLKVVIRLKAGLCGTSGPLGLNSPYESQVVLSNHLMMTKVDPYASARGKIKLRLYFNNSVDLEALKEVLSLEPSTPFTLIREWFGASLEGDFVPGQRYALKISKPNLKDNNKNYPRADLFSVFIPDREPEVWFEQREGYLGAGGNRALIAHTVNLQNLKVIVTKMYENNIVAWRNTVYENRWYGIHHFSQVVTEKSIKLDLQKNQIQDIRLTLDELLPPDLARDGVYEIKIASQDENQNNSYYSYRLSDSAIVTLSDIGLVAKQSTHSLLVWALSLSTAKPLENIHIRLFSNKNQFLGETITDVNGVAKIDQIHASEEEMPSILIAGSQPSTTSLTWLDLRTSELSYSNFDISGSPYLRSGYEAFVYTERGAYRPGETVHLWTMIRGPNLTVPAQFPIWWQFHRPDSRNWKGKMDSMDSNGMSHLSVKLPTDIPTGRWTVSVGLPKSKESDFKEFGSVSFLVEEFLPDRMKIALTLRSTRQGRHFLSRKPLLTEIQGDYLFGQAAQGCDAVLTARLDPIGFKPVHWKGWTFGDTASTFKTLGFPLPQSQSLELPKIRLDEKGKGRWKIDLHSLVTNQKIAPDNKTLIYTGPWQLTLLGSVQEMGGRAVSTTQEVLIDRSPYYLGLCPQKAERAEPGSPYFFNVRALSPQGKLLKVSGEVEIKLFSETWNNILTYRDGSYCYDSTRRLEEISSFHSPLKNGKGTFEIVPSNEGSYVVWIKDLKTEELTSYAFYVSSDEGWNDNVSRENPDQLQLKIIPLSGGAEEKFSYRTFLYNPFLILSKSLEKNPSSFRVGDKAQVIVRSPFAGRLLLTVETDDVIFHKVQAMSQSSIAIPIEISEAYRPNAYVSATVIQAIPANASWKVHRAFGVTRLSVNNENRKLKLKMNSPDEILPKTKVRVGVEILNPKGEPIEHVTVTLAAVDEGILQLTNFSTPNPFLFFHRNRGLEVSSADLYRELFPEIPRLDPKSPIGGDGGYDPRHLSLLSAQRVQTVALVSKVLHSNKYGKVYASFHLPEFTGKVRVMAIAHSGNLFGSTSKPMIVRSPLILQSTSPRFVATDDRFEIPVTLFNHTGKAGSASLLVELPGENNPLRFSESSERKLNLSSPIINEGGQTMIFIPLHTQKQMGIAQIQMKAELNGEQYEQNLEFPVRSPYPMTSEGAYAVVTPHSATKIKFSEEWIPGTTKLNLHMTPFPTLNLINALDYLNQYPHGCAEQTVSTIFPLIGLEKIGEKVFPDQFSKEYIVQRLETGFTRLMSMQTSDGGLAMWPGYSESWSWASIYAAHFMIEAENEGYSIPIDFRDRLLSYVRKLLNGSSDDPDTLETQAYACFVLAKAGKPERSIMTRLEDMIQKPSHETALSQTQEIHPSTRFYLALAWFYSGRRDLAMNLIPQTLPTPRQDRQLTGNVGSAIRDQAILTQALLEIDPQNPVIPKLVQEIAQAGDEKKWQSTQDNAFALLALGHYLEKTDLGQPFESAEFWVGSEKMMETQDGQPLFWSSSNQAFEGKALHVKVSGAKETKGYLAWTLTGIPKDPPKNEDHGLSIRRRYLDENGNPLSLDQLRSGNLVQIELTIETQIAYDNIVIEDLLPAGLEIENPRLATSAQILNNNAQITFMDNRIDIRDDRLVLYGKMSGKGKANYCYLARAVTPGIFTIPPVRAECMYDISINSMADGGKTLKISPNR